MSEIAQEEREWWRDKHQDKHGRCAGYDCLAPWPCLPIRLLDALEAAEGGDMSHLLADKDANEHTEVMTPREPDAQTGDGFEAWYQEFWPAGTGLGGHERARITYDAALAHASAERTRLREAVGR